jgi:transposase
MEKTDARTLSSEAQYELRKQIIRFINKGNTIQSAMEAYGVSKPYVQKIKKLYKEKCMRGLRLGKRGRKLETKVSKDELKEIKKLIVNKMPEQLQLPFGLWTRKSVSALIEMQFGIKVSRWTVGRYLRQMGLTPQKPSKRAFEQDSKRVEAWLKRDYPLIRQKAKLQNAKILWGDEMGLRSDDQVGRTYAPKGKTPVVKKTGNRFSINMISAISNRGDLKFMIIQGRFNSKVFIDFLGRMLKGERQKIFLIVDGHSAHKSKMVKDWISKRPDRLEIFFLPPYSPELNPDEYLNQDIKTNTVRSKPPRTKDEMTNTTIKFLEGKKRSKKSVKKYFQNEFINYAA